jgi:hypothetical protein
MAATEKFEDMRDSINAGLDNLEKWYGKTDDTDVYFICLGELLPIVHSTIFGLTSRQLWTPTLRLHMRKSRGTRKHLAKDSQNSRLWCVLEITSSLAVSDHLFC